jgi:hypothetical protein
MSSVYSADDAQVALPKDVDDRLTFWNGLWHRSSMYHYFFGVVSVAASVISTSTDGNAAKACSIVAAIATSMIGFMHPERRYLKFVRAWRVLDLAAMRYRHGLIDKAALIDAVEKGEACIAEFEEKYNGTSAVEDPNGGASPGSVDGPPSAPSDAPGSAAPAPAEPAPEPGPAPAATPQAGQPGSAQASQPG